MATVVREGAAPFTVAATADIVVERRTLPGEAAADALAEVRALVDEVTARTPGLTAEVQLTHAREAWQADAAGNAAEFTTLLGEALVAGSKTPHVGEPYWMESVLWQAAGVPTVVCGPAGGVLHAVDEWVEVARMAGDHRAQRGSAGRRPRGDHPPSEVRGHPVVLAPDLRRDRRRERADRSRWPFTTLRASGRPSRWAEAARSA